MISIVFAVLVVGKPGSCRRPNSGYGEWCRDVCSANVNPAVFRISSACYFVQALEYLRGVMALSAVIRVCGQELARGLSTGLTVAAASRCPPCQPSLNCGCPACPDCICHTGEVRAVTSGGCEPQFTLPSLALGGLWLFLLGVCVGWCLRGTQGPPGRRSHPSASWHGVTGESMHPLGVRRLAE